MKKNKFPKVLFSIFVIWLFTLSGIIGVLSPYEKWFLALTPLSLLLSFFMLIWHVKPLNLKFIIALSIPFVIGFVAEALGVNFGLIFGNYTYGNNLGVKIAGVPLLICFNWALLTIATADVAKYISKNIWIKALIAAALMTGIDVILEVSAPRFDFWEFENGIVPIQNYIGWFCTAFLAHIGYQHFKIKSNATISWHVLISIVIFFTVFLVL